MTEKYGPFSIRYGMIPPGMGHPRLRSVAVTRLERRFGP